MFSYSCLSSGNHNFQYEIWVLMAVNINVFWEVRPRILAGTYHKTAILRHFGIKHGIIKQAETCILWLDKSPNLDYSRVNLRRQIAYLLVLSVAFVQLVRRSQGLDATMP